MDQILGLLEERATSDSERNFAKDAKTAFFIKQARAVHGDVYGYENTRFLNNNDPVTVRCLRHELFTQNARKHLRGSGCKKCGAERRGAAQSKAAGMAFTRKALAVHGDRYDYNDVEYRGARALVTIGCRRHIPFQQEARVHLSGSGCPSCGVEAMAASRLSQAASSYIKRARAVHGDRYDYKVTVFTASRSKVTIGCRAHVPFKQYPHAHLQGTGCPRCGSEASAAKRRRDQADFVADAMRVHGHLYDYSRVEYRRRSGTVKILCASHGEFPQVAGQHLQGRGCPDCGNARQAAAMRHSLDEFIEAARARHGDRYDYKSVCYETLATKVLIRCPEHDVFYQEAGSHLKGSGCPTCSSKRIGDLLRKDTPAFIKDARAVHGNTYAYHLVQYRANDEKVFIECLTHGVFPMAPSNHLTGQGCPECGIERIRKARQKSDARFLQDARRVHGDRYDYSQVNYTHSLVPVTILCRSHPPFTQTPGSHLQGSGCPRCNHFVSKPETEWLDSLGVPERSVPLGTSVRIMVVDGYDPDTRTAYLFHGDYWHGNPQVFPPDGMHAIKGKTYGELYRTTIQEEEWLRQAGYRVVSMWERDYRALTTPS